MSDSNLFPDDVYYTRDHEWLRIEGQEATIGITAFAAGELGDIVYLDVPAIGELSAGNIFGTIEAVKTVSDLFLPISGRIIAVNSRLTDTPELVNADPYGEGWLVRIAITGAATPGSLLNEDQYKALINY